MELEIPFVGELIVGLDYPGDSFNQLCPAFPFVCFECFVVNVLFFLSGCWFAVDAPSHQTRSYRLILILLFTLVCSLLALRSLR